MGRHGILAVIVIIMYIATAVRAMPHVIETEDMTVTVAEVGFALDDTGDTHESVVLKDASGTAMTFRAKGGDYYIDSKRGHKAGLIAFTENFKRTNHSLNAGDKITVTLKKYDDGRTIVKYNNQELVRIK